VAFPTVVNTATTSVSTATTTPAYNLPTPVQIGDLLVVWARCAVGTTGITFPAGWTERFVLASQTADASDDATQLAWKMADGTEGATVSCTTTSSKGAAIAYQLRGARNPATVGSWTSGAVGTSTTPDPGSSTPTVTGAESSHQSTDYLWLWFGGWEGEQTPVPPTGNPTNYTNPIGASSGTGGAVATNCQVASARRENSTATEDPPSWTISASDDWMAYTVAIAPATSLPHQRTDKRLLVARYSPEVGW
jgi:hypothetical protein